MKIISRIYKVILVLHLFIGAYSSSIMAMDPLKRPTAEELLAQIPAVQSAYETLKTIDDQLYKDFMQTMQASRDSFLTMMYTISSISIIKSQPNLSIALKPNGQNEDFTWDQKANAAYAAALKKENYTDAQKEKALADVRAAQATAVNPELSVIRRFFLTSCFTSFELPAWEYYDPIWNKEVYAPEINKLGELMSSQYGPY